MLKQESNANTSAHIEFLDNK